MKRVVCEPIPESKDHACRKLVGVLLFSQRQTDGGRAGRIVCESISFGGAGLISNRDVLVRSLAGWFGVAAFILLMIVHLTGGDSALLARFTLASLAGLITPAFGEGDSLILFGGVLAGPLISVLINLGLFRIVKGAPRSLYVFSAGGMSVLWHSIGAGELFASV